MVASMTGVLKTIIGTAAVHVLVAVTVYGLHITVTDHVPAGAEVCDAGE